MFNDPYQTPMIVSGAGMSTHAGSFMLACGAVVPHLGSSEEMSASDFAELKRKYSGLLIVFDRFRDHLLTADSEEQPQGDWSIREILGHMVDTDRQIWWPRIAAVLDHDKPFLDSVEPEDLLKENHWNELSVELILAQFMQFRWNCAIKMKDLTPQDFARTGVHYELGPISVGNILEILTAHDAHYLMLLRRRVGLPEF